MGCRLEAFAWKASTYRLQDGTTPCGFSPVDVFDGFLRIFSLQVHQLLASKLNVSISTCLASVRRFQNVRCRHAVLEDVFAVLFGLQCLSIAISADDSVLLSC